MRTFLRERIVGYLRTNRQARAHDLVRAFAPISRVSIHTQLRNLVEDGVLRKIGKPPLVFYALEHAPTRMRPTTVSPDAKHILDAHYLYVSPQGDLLYGLEGFTRWAREINQENQTGALATRYQQVVLQYEQYRKPGGWIDATKKLTDTFEETFIDKLLYADFYSYPQFGKTKLGAMVLYAKQSQHMELIQSICQHVKPLIETVVRRFRIDAVGFIPPSIPRQIQFLHELQAGIRLSAPQIPLVKTRSGDIIVAQKTLERLGERVENARASIFVKEPTIPYHRVLLVDDAVGSGASMNETAKKIHSRVSATERGTSIKIVGFALVGSIKGFEVIREV